MACFSKCFLPMQLECLRSARVKRGVSLLMEKSTPPNGMNEIVTFFTDAATLALFDPTVLNHRIEDASDWWIDTDPVPEVAAGHVAIVELGADGVYQVRVTNEALTSDERDYAAEVVNLGFRIISGKLFVGKGEVLPGDGLTLTPDIATENEDGRLLACAPGTYHVKIYNIEWHRSARWWGEDGAASENTPPDYVAVIRAREEVFQLAGRPRFSGVSGEFLFESTTRQIGPTVGMILRTRVIRRRDELILKSCGPEDYQPYLEDYSGLGWGDEIRFRVAEVDREGRRMRAELLGKV